MTEFMNEFEVKKPVTELDQSRISYDAKYDVPRSIRYKVAAHVARKLTDEMKAPIASWGDSLLTEKGVSLPRIVTVLLKLEGVPTDVEVAIERSGAINKETSGFSEAAEKFLNRKIDLILTQNNYDQDGRRFFERKLRNINSEYAYCQGLQIAAHVNESGHQTAIVDPATQVKNKLNLLQALKKELDKREIKHWSQVGDAADEINKAFRTKGYNLRSTYVEQRAEDLEHNSYRFAGFDFTRGLKDDSDERGPATFHKKYNRKFSMDQPIVKLLAHGGLEIHHIPELIEESPSLQVMKRYGVSSDIQAKSQMNANDRYFMTHELLEPLVKSGLVDNKPTEVKVEYFGPVMLTLPGDFIEVKGNADFQQIYKKKKLFLTPKISSIHIFSSKKAADSAQRLVQVLQEIFSDFGLSWPAVDENLDCPPDDKQFAETIIEAAKKGKYSEGDLVLAVTKFSTTDDEDYAYNAIKASSLGSIFPVQFVVERQISRIEDDKNLKTDLARPLFLQIVAKCMGQPYGLQEGFAPHGTVFVGVDRYRDPFKRGAPLVTSLVLFDEYGSYVCSAASIPADSTTVEPLTPLFRSCILKFGEIKKKKISRIFAFVDTGVGTLWNQLMGEAKELENIADEIGATFAYVSADKGTRLRVYSGDPSDELSAKKVNSFSAVIEMKNKMEIVTVTTEPITSPNKEIGTPKSVLYTILRTNENDIAGLKKDLAKCIVWLCKHAWISPASTRIPAPIFFANKVSKLTAATGVAITPDGSRAPLFL